MPISPRAGLEGSGCRSAVTAKPQRSYSRRARELVSVTCQSVIVVARTRTMPHGPVGGVRRTTCFPGRGILLVAVIPGQPVLGRHPDHDLAVGGVGRDIVVAALGSQVPAGQFEPV